VHSSSHEKLLCYSRFTTQNFSSFNFHLFVICLCDSRNHTFGVCVYTMDAKNARHFWILHTFHRSNSSNSKLMPLVDWILSFFNLLFVVLSHRLYYFFTNFEQMWSCFELPRGEKAVLYIQVSMKCFMKVAQKITKLLDVFFWSFDLC
jgi:hypothetical protein